MSAQPSLILGTAGHIDHGKSSLVQALTGTDPDRLAEEKRRGITIELGFAQLTLPSGRALGVVDVPGHERFVRSMVAGATGVDVALLAIAADDGVMPQTVEHLAVLELLGVRSLVVALTKIDLVDEEWRAFVADEVAARLEASPYAGAPIVGVSSRTGEGLDELRSVLDAAAAAAQRTKLDGPARMPVDRVFTVKGFGTVATGTLWSGTLSEGDALTVLPAGTATRVRSVQTHGRAVDEAAAGNRVAVSLAGLSTDEVRPGDFLAAPGSCEATDRFDAEFSYRDPFSLGKPLKSGARVHVAHGTREVLGRVLFMDGLEALAPGGRALAQLRLEEPLPVAYRDRFVVRSYSPVHVIGGGTVLTAHPRRRTNLQDEERVLLGALESGDVDGAVGAHLGLAALPETLSQVAAATGLGPALAEEALARLADEGAVAMLAAREPLYARPALIQRLVAGMERALMDFHSANPQATGMAKDTLRQAAAPQATPTVFDALLGEAARRGAVVSAAGEVSHPKAGAGARMAEAAAADQLSAALAAAGAAPPTLPEFCASSGMAPAQARKAAAALERDGRAVRIDSERFYDAQVVAGLREVVAGVIRANGPATAADLKDAMGVSRKYAMPLLELFDATGLTRREGDLRVLVER